MPCVGQKRSSGPICDAVAGTPVDIPHVDVCLITLAAAAIVALYLQYGATLLSFGQLTPPPGGCASEMVGKLLSKVQELFGYNRVSKWALEKWV